MTGEATSVRLGEEKMVEEVVEGLVVVGVVSG